MPTTLEGKVFTAKNGDLYRRVGMKKVFLTEEEVEQHLNGDKYSKRAKKVKTLSPIDVNFQLERETPGAVRYQEITDNGKALTTKDDDCIIGSLYIRKTALGKSVPKKLTVTITPE